MMNFKKRISASLNDPTLQEALSANATRRRRGREKAFKSLLHADDVRTKARAIRQRSIDNLDVYTEQFMESLQANGIVVHMAQNKSQAQDILFELVSMYQADTIAKSKSMVSEEIEMNQALARLGITVVETDLGEYIVQLRDEKPSHIITPAIHLKRNQVAETFHEMLGMPYSSDVKDLIQMARSKLREVFIDADIGVSGINFGIADSGILCIVTNEGNGRMVTTLPRIHIAVMGMERIIPSLEDLEPMLQLLPRSATGQILSSYVSLLQNPRKAGALDGPEERHLILIDNRRRTLLQTPLEEALLCIRCGACLNICPVFQNLGGHPYASPYPGPIGSVLSPGLWGVDTYGHLAKASTLCGLCREVCPVDIDIPGMLLEVRQQNSQKRRSSRLPAWMMKLYAWVMVSPRRFHFALRMAAAASRLMPRSHGWIRWAPGLLNAWTETRDLPSFRLKRNPSTRYAAKVLLPLKVRTKTTTTIDLPLGEPPANVDPTTRWVTQFRAVDGEVLISKEESVADHIVGVILEQGGSAVLLSPELHEHYPGMGNKLQEAQIALIEPMVPDHLGVEQQREHLRSFDQVPFGITSVSAGLANSGTIILNGSEIRSGLASLLPDTHIAILDERKIYPDLATWLAEQPTNMAEGTTVLITGPSRTADIEMTLTIGVHGPARLIVCLVTEDADHLSK
jgi:L-lactate dehydrogenase complex protein LldF